VVFRATDNQSPVGDTSVPNQARAPVMSLDCRWSCEPWNGTRVAILETHETLKIGSRRMPWEADTFIMPAAAEEKPSVKPDELALDRERRYAARRFFPCRATLLH
jgi:hypothetical protein